MPPFLYFAMLAALAIAAGMVILPLRQRRKLRRKLAAGFGMPPTGDVQTRPARLFWRGYDEAYPSLRHVDDLTWSDLDLDEVYAAMNACQSAPGDISLYMALRQPMNNEADIAYREALMVEYDADEALRLQVLYQMAMIGRRGATSLELITFHVDALALPRRHLYRVLAFLPLLAVPLALVVPLWGLLWALATLVTNLVLTSVIKRKNEAGFEAVRYLSVMLAGSKKLAKTVAVRQPQLAARLCAAAVPFGAFTRSYTMLAFDEAIEKSGFADPASFIMLPLLSYGKMAAGLQEKQEEILALCKLLGQVDLAVATLSLRQSLPAAWCRPEYINETQIKAKDLWHPLLSQPVPNDACFEGDVLLTGSNASGKSTFIKALALNCLLAQGIGLCTAKAFQLRAGFVASSMAVEDSIVDGDSYFIAEIKSMRRLMSLTEESFFCYFFIDEILKGTNTIERVAASSAVLQHLHGAHCQCFAATHDMELTGILQGQYENVHFRESVTDEGVLFDYKLYPGPATSRNAILLLERMEFPPDVTHSAHGLVQRFEQRGEW